LAHLDQYDVFIIQGTGRRRWRVGEKVPMKQHCPPDLLQVDPFDGIIDEELEPGDILYIPPGFPHRRLLPGKLPELSGRVPRAKRPRDDQRICRLCSAAGWKLSLQRSRRLPP
jgi:hypothetical protein